MKEENEHGPWSKVCWTPVNTSKNIKNTENIFSRRSFIVTLGVYLRTIQHDLFNPSYLSYEFDFMIYSKQSKLCYI